MRALGLDVGSKTIGLARSDPGGVIATAWEVLARRGHEDDAREVVARVVAEDVSSIVVGLPLELDGREGRRARAVRAFIDALGSALSTLDRQVSILTWDERFSTAAAERTMIEADVSRAKRKEKIDAVAAQYILQGWLDAQEARGETS
jgi:putative Holliday junction resolvase